jgi:hypothetical protein
MSAKQCVAAALGALLCVAAHGQSKFDKWRSPSFFRGFNVGAWSSHHDRLLGQDDFTALKQTGAGVAVLQTPGFRKTDYPYSPVKTAVNRLDSMAEFCRAAGLYYVISVRTGPGRNDPALEGSGLSAESGIWRNVTEQYHYARMLADMAARYDDDTLFAGLDMLQEPVPLWDRADKMPPGVVKTLLAREGIDVNTMYGLFIREVRKAAAKLPLIVQNVMRSDPAYFSLLKKQPDTNIVYNVHCYNPAEYTRAPAAFETAYPDTFYDMRRQGEILFDREALRGRVLSTVRNFET